MQKFPVVVSFFTKNTPYEDEVRNLIASCKRFGLETSIDGVDSFGSWELNCAFKPFFLHQKLQELKKPLLWVDADAVFIRQPPVLDLFAADFAVRVDPELPDDHLSKVMSGTIFVNHTDKAKEILRRWAQTCVKEMMRADRREEFWDQAGLRDVLLREDFKALGADLRNMPLAWYKVSGHKGHEQQVEDPIVEHYQASRRFKHIVNGG
jgi:hypothetical protein